MTVGEAFVFVCETCERGRVKDFEQRSRSIITRFFPVDSDECVIMECTGLGLFGIQILY